MGSIKRIIAIARKECRHIVRDSGALYFAIGLPLLPISPGNFSLDLLFEGEILGSWRVTVKRQPSDNTTKSE